MPALRVPMDVGVHAVQRSHVVGRQHTAGWTVREHCAIPEQHQLLGGLDRRVLEVAVAIAGGCGDGRHGQTFLKTPTTLPRTFASLLRMGS